MPRLREAGGVAQTAASAVEVSRILSAEELQPLLDRILASRHFASAGRRKKFLTVVTNYYLSGRADELNEFCLASEVFGFDQHYDPAGNASVRVCAHDVRKRLKEYFEQEGTGERLLLQIPPGAYKPLFLERELIAPPAPVPADPIPLAPVRSRWRWILPLIGAAALVLTGAVAISLRWLPASLRTSAIWKPFLEGQGPILVVMSNPPLFQFLWASDPVRSRQNLIPLGPEALAAIERQLGPNSTRMPYLVFSPEDYTGMGEALGLMHLTRFFSRAEREILVKQSITTGTEDLKNHHAVLVGGPLSNQLLPRSESLDFDLGGNFVLNRNPMPGEQREYRLTVDPVSGQPATDWAVITVAPGIAPGRVVMVLAGIRSEGTQAAAEFVTEPRYADELQRRLDQKPARFFQALVRVEVKKWQPAALSLIAVHPLADH
ncbi:MAG: hypothetical protein JNL98_11565 [Bryobacterales bacterium]|nr:hypothetical protein [Bryobacterales bacterium]